MSVAPKQAEEEAIPGQVITKQPVGRDVAAEVVGDVGSGNNRVGDDDKDAAGGRRRAEDEAESEALSELSKADKIVVEQKAQYSEACCGYEGENRFDVSDSFGNVIMRATENSNCCLRQCCDQLRPFTMGIVDRAEQTVITVRRPLRCNNCYCCPCLTQRLEVEWPPGADIGYVDQNLSVFSPSFDVFDASGEKMFIIQGPSSLKNRCRNCCCGCFSRSWQLFCGCALRDINFKILEASGGKQVGVITKKAQPPGVGGSLASEMDRFGIDFPDDADLSSKILLTATCFLIDFLYFEGGNEDLDGDDG